MKTLKGKLTITRVDGNVNESRMCIRVEDVLSGCEAVEVTCGIEAFAFALTAMASQPCDVEFNDSGVIGKKRETKEEVVHVPAHDYRGRDAAYAEALKPFEVDGWVARGGDLGNGHRRVKGGGTRPSGGESYRAVFWRWVEVK